MRTEILISACLILLGSTGLADAKNGRQKSMATENKLARSTLAEKFTSSPLRNRVRIELKSPVTKVWELIGDLAKFPEYSSGLSRVEEKRDSSGKLLEYVCHFKPQEGDKEGIISREKIRWYEPQRGYASSGAQADAFGLNDDLHLMTLEKSKEGTILTVEEYFGAKDLPMMKSHFDQALGDIANNLVNRFGGKVIERYVEK